MTLVLLAKEGEKTKESSIIYIQRDSLIGLDDDNNSDPKCKLGHLDLPENVGALVTWDIQF